MAILLCSQLGCRNDSQVSQPYQQEDVMLNFKKVVESSGDASILIDPSHFNKQNIETLCLSYHQKYKSWPRNLSVQIFTDEEAFDSFVEGQKRSHTQVDIDSPKILDWNRFFQRQKKSYSAVCRRTLSDTTSENSSTTSNSGFDLVFWYVPNLNEPKSFNVVVLRGATHTEGKYNEQSYNIAGKFGRIIFHSYDIYNVEPPTRYYSAIYSSLGSPRNYSRTIFNIKLNEAVQPMANQIKFYNDKTASMYLGWIYSVTTDAGKTWHLWDAEMDLPNWKCCNSALLKNVSISEQGNGVMTLRLDSKTMDKLTYLYTNDFGQHWRESP